MNRRLSDYLGSTVAQALGVLAVWFFAFILLELGCYAYLRFVPQRFNPAAHYLGGMIERFHPLFKPEAVGDSFNYYPFVGFYKEGDWSKTKTPYAIPEGWLLPLGPDGQGLERYASPEKPKGTIRIAAMGGSTMAGVGQSSKELAIPARIEALLRASNPGKKIEVLDFSMMGHTSAEEMVLLATKTILFNPDLIILMDGFNDSAKHYYFPDMPPLWGQFHEYLHRVFRRNQSLTGAMTQFAYLISNRFYCLAIPRALLFSMRTSRPASTAPSNPAAFDDKAIRRGIAEYVLDLKSMIGIASAHDIPIIVALQPNVYYRKELSSEEKEYRATNDALKPLFSKWTAAFYASAGPRFNEAFASRSTASVRALDLTAMFDKNPETLYVDSCHYNDRAAEVIAKRLETAAAGLLKLNP